jgi:CubicO group peptidase (beta-lactamase class C family)
VWPWPSARASTTRAVDLAALVDRIQRGQILTAANRERLWTPLTGATGYGMGFRLQRTNACTRDVGKDGAQLGANSYVLVYPELGVTVAVLTNRDGPHDARDVADDIGALIQSTECP